MYNMSQVLIREIAWLYFLIWWHVRAHKQYMNWGFEIDDIYTDLVNC